MVSVDSVDSVDTVNQPLTRFMFLMSYRDDYLQQEFDSDDNSNQVNSVRINETRVESNTNNKSNGDHSAADSRICRKDSRTSKDLPPVPPREREPPPREREPPPVPSMESLISRRASSSKNNNEIYSKLRL